MCMCFTRSLSTELFKRVIQNMEVQKIHTIFETVQAQISNLNIRDHEIHGLDEQVDWTSGHAGEHVCYLIHIKSVCIQ